MRFRVIFGLATALAVSTSALAFQEQQVGGTPQPDAAPPAAAAPAPAPDLGVAPQVAAPSAPAGTEVRIPGLGKLGVLPKMDFGLELLYGASEAQKPEIDSEVPGSTGDDLTIRGSLKHNF